MDWSDTQEQAAFRAEVRSVIQRGLPDYYRRMADGEKVDEAGAGDWTADRKSPDPEVRAAAKEWGDTLASHGWFAPQWPKEYGGGGLTSMEQFIYNQEMSLAGAPLVGGLGVTHLGPTLLVHGTPEQKQKWLPPILSGEVVYRQGYSEPEAGSDLASLKTRAVRDGDEFVINGQKIWTTGAHDADALFMLVRTDQEAPKHRGITFLVVEDIHTPGLTIRPLVNMADHHSFNETFFEDVRVPVDNAIGEVNRGWYVAATLLDYERSRISAAVIARRSINILLEYVDTEEGRERSRLDRSGGESASLRHEIADRYIETEVGFNFAFRVISMQNRGLVPNYEASVGKMFMSESSQRLQRTGTKMFGLYSNIWDSASPYAATKALFTKGYVTSVSATIAAGTSEIQRGIIATRGLGLPRG